MSDNFYAKYPNAGGSSSDNTKIAAITFSIDGAGAVILPGVQFDLYIPYACTINSNTILADVSGSIVIDILKAAYSGYPPITSICASAKPTIAAAIKSQDTTLTGWTTSISAGDTLRFNVDSCTSITRATLTLKVTKT